MMRTNPPKQKNTEQVLVRSIAPRLAYPLIMTRHYAQRIPSISYAFGVELRDELIGVCTFGTPANSAYAKMQYEILELNRLCIIHEKAPKNIASILVSSAIKKLPKDLILVSYADSEAGHVGYIYQATNWIYTGLSNAVVKYIINGEEYIQRSASGRFGSVKMESLISRFGKENVEKIKVGKKHRYFMPLPISKKQKKEMIFWINAHFGIEETYPKGDTKRHENISLKKARGEKKGMLDD